MQSGNLHHCGHMHVHHNQLRIQSRFVQPRELKVAKDALSVRIPSTSSASLLYQRTGLHLEWHQLQYLKTKDKNELVMQSRDDSQDGHVTAADRLLAQLDNDPTTTYVCLFGEFVTTLDWIDCTLTVVRIHFDSSATNTDILHSVAPFFSRITIVLNDKAYLSNYV